MKTMLPDLWTRDLMTDPFRALERDLFGRDFPKLFEMPARQAALPVPAMNIAETENAIEATLEIPGVEEKDIKVRVEGDRLIVSGEKNWETKKDEKDWHVVERRYGAFNRSVLLPFEPAADAITAHYDKGVLHLTVQKPAAKTTAAKTIPVMTGAPKVEEPAKPH
ncbi:Hsp20/alpha crystallin family protein [Rhodoblastus sp.]|uniref:Hsp20/alpha crystallin family protein n=1 Tax=Rhodoblastus sp. TaxID=1962975 RepID=UPI003F94582D